MRRSVTDVSLLRKVLILHHRGAYRACGVSAELGFDPMVSCVFNLSGELSRASPASITPVLTPFLTP